MNERKKLDYNCKLCGATVYDTYMVNDKVWHLATNGVYCTYLAWRKCSGGHSRSMTSRKISRSTKCSCSATRSVAGR